MTKQVLLIAEDDPDDALLLQRALKRATSELKLVCVANGDDAIAYVQGTGAYSDRREHPVPSIMLLDLKMPRKDGFEVLQWRRRIAAEAGLPVVVFSSSALRQDIDRAYALGANSYIVKPTAPSALDGMVKAFVAWWIELNVTTVSVPA